MTTNSSDLVSYAKTTVKECSILRRQKLRLIHPDTYKAHLQLLGLLPPKLLLP